VCDPCHITVHVVLISQCSCKVDYNFFLLSLFNKQSSTIWHNFLSSCKLHVLVLLDHHRVVCIKTYNKGKSAVYVYTFLWGWCSWIHASYYNSHGNSQRDATVYQNFLLFHVYIKLNMFRATRRLSSRAQNCTSSLWFCICERLLDVVVAVHCSSSLWFCIRERLLDVVVAVQQPQRPTAFHVCKTRGC